MMYLNELGFNEKDIKNIATNTPENIKSELEKNGELIKENIEFLKELGVKNFVEIFSSYSEMFLMDNTNFKNIFLKYDREDLVEKLARNIKIIEHL